ncbi:MAG: amidohydrolase family protein [Planctomycetota bacterium]
MTMLSAVCLLALCPMPQGEAAPQAMLVKAKTIVVAAGERLEDGHILLRGGKVAAVGATVPAELGPDVVRVDLGDAVIVPGFVVPHAYLGRDEDLAETADAYTPDLRAVDGYDPFGDEARHMLQGGVTTAVVAPRSTNTLAGIGGAVKTTAGGGAVREQCYLKVALVPESLDQQRFPTSRMGAMSLLRAAFDSANSPTAALTTDRQALRDVTGGGLPMLVHARTRDEICCALDLIDPGREGVLAGTAARVVLLGADEASKCLDRLVALRVAVWLEPLRPGADEDVLSLPARLAGRRVPFAFAANSAAELRLSAALAVRHGLDPHAALVAMTQAPATMLGIDDRVGSLQQGKDADLVAFTGDPVDLGARIVAVCVGGKPVVAPSPLPSRD